MAGSYKGRASKLSPRNKANCLTSEGNLLVADRKFTDAIKFYSRALELSQDDVVVLNNRSHCYYSTQQYEKSLEDADMSLQVDRQRIKSYCRKTDALVGLRKYAEAGKCLSIILQLDPTYRYANEAWEYVSAQQYIEMNSSYSEVLVKSQAEKDLRSTIKKSLSLQKSKAERNQSSVDNVTRHADECGCRRDEDPQTRSSTGKHDEQQGMCNGNAVETTCKEEENQPSPVESSGSSEGSDSESKESRESEANDSENRKTGEGGVGRCITEEEREKLRKEKKKAKKKKIRNKKIQEKKAQDVAKMCAKGAESKGKRKKKKKPKERHSSEEEGIDPHSAFFTASLQKKKNILPGLAASEEWYIHRDRPVVESVPNGEFDTESDFIEVSSHRRRNNSVPPHSVQNQRVQTNTSVQAPSVQNQRMQMTKSPVARLVKEEVSVKDDVSKVNRKLIESKRTLQQVRHYANLGKEALQAKEHEAAADWYSKAILLYPTDPVLHNNRSLCYIELGMYRKALMDAEQSITLLPQNIIGYFRKGTALKKMEQYQEATKCFEMCVKLNPECKAAVEEIKNLRVIQLAEMGFSLPEAFDAATKYQTVEQAVEALVASNTKTVTNTVMSAPLTQLRRPFQ